LVKRKGLAWGKEPTLFLLYFYLSAKSLVYKKGCFMSRKLFWIIFAAIWVVVMPVAAWARIDVDSAVFRYDSTRVYWEIYYTIPRNQLTYVGADNNSFSSIVLLRLKIIKEGTIWKEFAWKVRDILSDTTETQRNKAIVDRIQVLAPPADYSVSLTVRDLHNSVYTDSASFSADISGFPSGELLLSDIELASSIGVNSHDKKNPFYKNTLLVVPNPSRVFGDFLPVLHFYVETYNLLKNIKGQSYRVCYSILDANGKPVDKIKPVSLFRKKQVGSRVEIGSVSVNILPMGTYFLHCAIADSVDKELISKDVKFYVYNKKMVSHTEVVNLSEDNLVQKSEFASMNEDELDQDFKYTDYITTPEQRNTYKSLKDVEAKRRFLYSLWKKFDTNPATFINEFHQEYMKRVRYCNQKFSVMKKEGWKTDRGRVFIFYGEPDYIDRNPSTEGYRPYEVWHYDEIQGGVIFVFADLSGFRDYTLLHSTARGEVHYPNYMERIRRGY